MNAAASPGPDPGTLLQTATTLEPPPTTPTLTTAPVLIAEPVAFALAPARWVLPQTSPAASTLAQNAGLPLLVAELLAERGISNAEEADQFLHPRLEHLLDPYEMQGMATAVPRVQAAIAGREPILIYGDYDVDGTTAIVLLKTALSLLGADVRFHVPHRLRDGYGMQAAVVIAAAAEGVRLIISVDTGMRDFAAAEAAAAHGVDLIVTDHHLPQDLTDAPALPPALAILNPNQPGCGYMCKHLCGAGVAFKLSQALLEAWDRPRTREKILPSFLKMLAIAHCCRRGASAGRESRFRQRWSATTPSPGEPRFARTDAGRPTRPC